MHRDARRVVVTGLGLVSPLGSDVATFWTNITSGRVATAPITRFRTEGYATHMAAEVRGPLASGEGPPRSVRYADHAVGAALDHAGLRGDPALRRAGLVLGTVMGTRPHLEELHRRGGPIGGDLSWDRPESLGREPARRFGLCGPRHIVAAGCAAGNTAMAVAADHIRSGQAEIMVTGGVDELSEAVFRLFATLRALAPDQVRPFDGDRRGMLPAEGAGVLVLESLEHARGRGANILAELRGCAIAADAHHMTAPHPQGHGILRCMRDGLDQAGVRAADVDYVSAHGTGTPGNDALEAACLIRYFGTGGPAVSSLKGMLGHCQGAASALEALACVLAITHGSVPGNPTLRTPDDACAGLDLVRGAARDMPVRVALSNAFGFGGNTSTVVLSGFTG